MRGQSPRLGVLINNMDGRYQTEILRSIRDFSAISQVQPVILSGRALGSPYPEDALHNTIYDLSANLAVDGLLVVAGAIGTNLDDAALAAKLAPFSQRPLVAIGRRLPGFPGIASEDGAGAFAAMDHLIRDHGLRNIAFLSGPEQDPASRVRMAAYRQALDAHGLPYRSDLVYWGDYSFQSCPEVVRQMTSGPRLPFEALFCANDEMAVGVLQLLEQQGYRAPQDYALVGFDDLLAFSHRTPGLTTVRQPLYELTMAAGTHLLQLIRKADPRPLKDIPSVFVRRETCGCTAIPLLQTRSLRPTEPTGTGAMRSRIDSGLFLEDFFGGVALSPSVRHEIEGLLPSLVDSIHLDLRAQKDSPLFLQGLNEWLEITFGWERYSETWNALLSRLHSALEAVVSEARATVYLSHLFRLAATLVSRRSDQRESNRRSKVLDLQAQFQTLSRRLNTARFSNQLVPVLRETLPQLGIDGAGLLLPGPSSDKSRLEFVSVLGPGDRLEDLVEQFTVRAQGELVFLPLVLQNRLFGFLSLSATGVDSMVFTTVQEEIAHALYVADLLVKQQAVEAQKAVVLEENRRSEERYREMAQMVPMMMWETDTRLTVTYLNRAAEQGLGLQKGQSLKPRLGSAERNTLDELWKKLAEGEELPRVGIRLLGSQGEAGVLVIQLTAIRSSVDGTLGLRWHALDPEPIALESTLPDAEYLEAHQISEREREVLTLVLYGLRTRAISERLGIAESTVKGHIGHIFDKFGVDSRSRLVDAIQEHQVRRHGHGNYLLMVLNRLLAGDGPQQG